MPSNTEKIMNSFNTFFEEHQNYSKKELLEFAKKAIENYWDIQERTLLE